jgi:Ni/Co efflux regulator RcnB
MNLGLKWGAALFLAIATVAAPAVAKGDHDRRGHHGQRDHDRRGHDRRDHRDHRQARRHDRRHDRRDVRAPVRVVHHRPVVVHHHGGHRPGPPPWARGGYVHHYQRPVYVVNDYRGYGLRHPPRGHRWMRDDRGDFLLVAIATGVIVDLLLR